jgi:osmotically-inducible protein OsmY
MGARHGPAEREDHRRLTARRRIMARQRTRFSIVAVVAVVMSLAACKTTEPPGRQVDDAAITAKVKAKLAADGDINPFNIDVDTNEGVVTLQGRVEKEESRTKAEHYARETSGVKRVINLVKVGGQS